tara:strand:+ start:514 stop:987 length:474 start_codon:yes stop_codon:yes gene_type:complete
LKLTKEILYKLIEEGLKPDSDVAKPDYAKKHSTLTIGRWVVGDRPAYKLRKAAENMLKVDFSQFDLSKGNTRKGTIGWTLRPTSQNVATEYIGILWKPKDLGFSLRLLDPSRSAYRAQDLNYLDIVDYEKTAATPEERLEIFIDDIRKQLQDWTRNW